MKNIQIIINPAAGKSEPILSVINDVMKEAGIKWEASITQEAGDGARFAKEAVAAGVDAVAVYGGDGTLMEVIGVLMESEVPLVILPGGSANVLANELGIPKDLKGACALIGSDASEIKKIDVGQFGKRYFLTQIGFGFTAELVKGADRETKNKYGIWAYFFSAIEALKKMTLVRYKIKIDGEEHKVEGLTCIIANTGNLGFTKISLDKHIDISDGFLDVLVVRKATAGLYKHILATLIKGERPDNLELVKHWQGKEITVSSNWKQVVQCDGEVLKTPASQIRIIPSAIKVLVPLAVQQVEPSK